MVRKRLVDGNIAMEAPCLKRVIQRDPTPGRAEFQGDSRHVAMVLGDLGLEETPVVSPVAKRPKSGELLLLAGAEPTQRNHLSLDRPNLSFAAGALKRGMKIPTTKNLEERNVLSATCEGDQLERSWLNRKHCLVFGRCSTMQTMLETWETRRARSGTAVLWRGTLDQAWELGAKHHNVECCVSPVLTV